MNERTLNLIRWPWYESPTYINPAYVVRVFRDYYDNWEDLRVCVVMADRAALYAAKGVEIDEVLRLLSRPDFRAGLL